MGFAIFGLFSEFLVGNKYSLIFEINEKISSTLVYKNTKRLNEEKYTVIDFRTSYNFDKFSISVILNNILDAEYSETNLVPMPGFNSLIGIKYSVN